MGLLELLGWRPRTLQKSRFAEFDPAYAAYLRKHHPAVWSLGQQEAGYSAWQVGRKDAGSTFTSEWLGEREDWLNAHAAETDVTTVISAIQVGGVLDLGEAGMKRVANAMIKKAEALTALVTLTSQPQALSKAYRRQASELLDQLMFDALGIVNLKKAKAVDPTSIRGFITLEELLARKLTKATAADTAQAQAAIDQIMADENLSKLSARAQKTLTRKVIKVVEDYGAKVGPTAHPIIQAATRDIYARTKTITAKTIPASAAFELKDERAIKALTQYQGLWVRSHFRDETTLKAQDIITRNLEGQGGSRIEAGKLLAEALGSELGDANYWRTVASANLSNGRTFSQLQSYKETEIEEFEFFNPMDERTSRICSALHGMIFSVEVALSQFAAMSQAQSVDELKDIAPWVSYSDKSKEFSILRGGVRESLGKADDLEAEALAAKGVTKPPLHGRCRSLILPV